MLAVHFLKGYVTKYRKPITGFSDAAMQGLLSCPWPGNVRQLDHTIERAVLMAQTYLIGPGDLGLQSSERSVPHFEAMTLEQIERWAGRPLLITEYYAVQDMPITEDGAGWLVLDQTSRALFYIKSTLGTGFLKGWQLPPGLAITSR